LEVPGHAVYVAIKEPKDAANRDRSLDRAHLLALQKLEPREAETRSLHSLAEYGLMHVKLYEDIARFGHIATTYDYPVMVDDRYLMAPSPIPKFDNPKMHLNPAVQLFGAGREKRIYAIPPYTSVRSLDFEDHPFEIQRWDHACALCGAGSSFLDEMIVDDAGGRLFVCSDSNFCEDRRHAGHVGSQQVVAMPNALIQTDKDEMP